LAWKVVEVQDVRQPLVRRVLFIHVPWPMPVGSTVLMSHTDQTEEELVSLCPLEVITQKSISKTPFQRIF
jgi:hypothetical protein